MLLGSCASERPAPAPAPVSPVRPTDPRALILRSIPQGVSDRAGWEADVYAGFMALKVPATPDNICAVAAVIEQESGFHVDPVIPGLPAIAWREIDKRAEHAGIPTTVVHEVLQLKSSSGQTYAERIDLARTEKDLSDVFEDFTGSVPLGRSVFASWNPIRTRGPMQVNVAFAEQFAKTAPYPYPVKVSIADELFTRRGSVYFGIAHLLDYQAPYDRYLYRFADYNAGQYASRNAAFQSALARASGTPLVPDGALVSHGGLLIPGEGNTELAARSLADRLNLGDDAIRSALEEGRTQAFERTALYQHVFALADRAAGRPLPRAIVPSISLKGPKIRSTLTTEWYAHRVNERFTQCLGN